LPKSSVASKGSSNSPFSAAKLMLSSAAKPLGGTMFTWRTRFWSLRSKLAKKCSRSAMMGPPTLAPNCRRSNRGRV
jgi:hypothetical protein